jgi:DNA-binding MarR family transcriptional regulator
MITVLWMIDEKFRIGAKVMADHKVMTNETMRYRLEDMGGMHGSPGSAVLLSRLSKQVYSRTDEDQLGMGLRHLISLSYMSDHDGCPQQDLADAFCMDANNVVLLLNELEQRGYATRERDPHDRRRHIVRITPAGREALARAEHAQLAVEDQVLEALSDEERATLRGLLLRALRSIEPADYSATIASIST